MFSWVSLALAIIKLANVILTKARENELISQGEDKEIAKQTAAILTQSKFAKDTMQQISSLSEQQVDDVLKELEK